jgi:hypothetical protein
VDLYNLRPDAALLDLEVGERGREETGVVGAEVRDQAVDLLGRGADAALGPRVQVGHAPIMPERPQPCSAAAGRSR